MTIPPNAPGHHLVGLKLAGGWQVSSKITRPPDATGGTFSVGYMVKSDADGRMGFLKAIDISKEITSGDPQALANMTEIYLFERDLLDLCKDSTRIITAITSGNIPVGTVPGTIHSPVFYLIFEMADSDARQQVNLKLRLPVPEVFEALHQVSTGLMQLHGKQIAHQDLKPSNVLYKKKGTSAQAADTKIGDLGRAVHETRGVPVLHANLQYLGTPAYTPPELLYGQLSSKWEERRIGCDLYSLGSLMVFFFCGQPTNVFLVNHLDAAHIWDKWAGSYIDVLAFVQAAFAQSLSEIRTEVERYIDPNDTKLPSKAKAVNDVMLAIEQLCDPNPATRGHPSVRNSYQFDLQRYVSLFDRLARRARAGML